MKRGENMSAIIRDKKYVTWDEKPVFAADYESAPDSLKQTPTLAIVMQGPLKLEENFTRETLKIYQKNFPDCPIVLSTWKTENADEIKKIEDLGVKVLLNSPPPIKGCGMSTIKFYQPETDWRAQRKPAPNMS